MAQMIADLRAEVSDMFAPDEMNSPEALSMLSKIEEFEKQKLNLEPDALHAYMDSVAEEVIAEAGLEEAFAEAELGPGELTYSGLFGLKTVKFFSNGYVQVGWGFPEKLISVYTSNQSSSKTGVGRTIGQVLMFAPTAGLSALTPSRRGDLIITIITENNTHVLQNSTPTTANVRALYEIEAEGNRLIALASHKEQQALQQPTSTAPKSDLAKEIQSLFSLYEAGALTPEEFVAAKKKLLG